MNFIIKLPKLKYFISKIKYDRILFTVNKFIKKLYLIFINKSSITTKLEDTIQNRLI